MTRLEIGAMLLAVDGIGAEEMPQVCRAFIVSDDADATPDMAFRFVFNDRLPLPDVRWQSVFRSHNIDVRQWEGREWRLLSAQEGDPYAVYEEQGDRDAVVYVLNCKRRELAVDPVFVSCLALERHQAVRGGYVLHCSYLAYRGEAILFCGPSGVGKSTHSALWEREIDGSSVVNGDKCLVRRTADGRFWANGWPVCGSSGICRNVALPVKAVVFLQQTPVNRVISEDRPTHFKRLYQQLMLNRWNPQQTLDALEWIENLAATTTILTYGCNMEAEAALLLSSLLL